MFNETSLNSPVCYGTSIGLISCERIATLVKAEQEALHSKTKSS
jgi:hypothetical protein